MAASDPPSDLIVKFDILTDPVTVVTLTTDALSVGESGISFNLQIIEKGELDLTAGSIGSTVVGNSTDKINTVTAQELAYLITRYFSDKTILAPGDATGAGRNIRSLKLIVNIDPSA